MRHAPIAVAIAAAAILASALAHADVLHNGKVYRTTADRIISDQQLACSYGPWQQVTLPNGATIISRQKTCQGEAR